MVKMTSRRCRRYAPRECIHENRAFRAAPTLARSLLWQLAMSKQDSVGRPEIIVVDDEPRVCRVVAKMVQRSFPDVVVRVAQDGDAALDLLKDETVCLVSDVEMPNCDGLRLCRTLRRGAAMKPWRTVPVVLMSALVQDEELVERAWESGTAYLLAKPFSESDLACAIARATGRASQRAAQLALPPAELSLPTDEHG